MENKEYYFDLFEMHFLNANPYWENPYIHTQLRVNTEETLDLLESYLKILKAKQKTYDKYNKNLTDYNQYTDDVKQAINNIIKLVNDGRDLWHPTKMTGTDKIYDHHINDNGHLTFENDPWSYINGKLSEIKELRKILESEKTSKQYDLNKFVNDKIYYLRSGCCV